MSVPRLSALFGVVLSVTATMALASAAHATDRVRLPGHVLPALSRATVVAPEHGEADAVLDLTLVLRRDDEAAFTAHRASLADPASPDHRRFLSQREIADRFGPSRVAYARVVDFLRGRGLTIVGDTAGPANRLTVTVRGSRAAIERAFDVRIGRYRIGERVFHANDRDPALPRAIAAHVQAIGGLSDLPMLIASTKAIDDAWKAVKRPFDDWWAKVWSDYEHSLNSPGSGGPGSGSLLRLAPPLAAGPPPTSWLEVDGTGQTVGIVALDTFDPADIADFLALAGLPSSLNAQVTRVPVNGGSPPGPSQVELLIDVLAILTNAPGAAVRVYDGPFVGLGSFQPIINAMINDGVTIITNSFAYCEDQATLADVQSLDAIFQNAAVAGVSIFNASGDTGSTCLDGSPNTVTVPAGSPNATAVGGSHLVVGPAATYGGETWWDGTADVPATGQGGFGVSRFFARPSYQDGFTTSAKRSVPDVVAHADPAGGVPLCQALGGGCPTGLLYGGTSLSAPLWAAWTALLNHAQGIELGLLNELLYPLAGTNAFHDAARLGSDSAHVGLGSPNLNEMHRALASKTVGPVDADTSQIDLESAPVPADGTSVGYVVVRLRDGNGHSVSGKTVMLAAVPSGNVQITPPSGVTTVDNGAVIFTVTNLVAEDVTFTATDTTDAVVLTDTPAVAFVVPPAAAASIAAFPTTVAANGTSTTTITVTLQDVLARPAPGKLVKILQGPGHSVISGPVPSVTDASGQIQFTATNRVSETVTYTAVDVTDGDRPVPGSAQVTFSGASFTCVDPDAPVGLGGYVVSPFVTGFFAENFFFGGVNWGGCAGATPPVFLGPNELLAANFRTGGLYRYDAAGGAISNANLVTTLGQTLGAGVVGKDDRVYVTFGSSGAGGATGSVAEIDPETGAVLRTVASGQRCPAGLAVDPLSGDLFFSHTCFGGGLDDATIARVRNPGSATPIVETYVTLPTTPNGVVVFDPKGNLYVPVGYTQQNPAVIRVGGTDTPAPPAQTPLAGVTSIFFATVGATAADGTATSFLGLTLDGLVLYDLTVTPAVGTLIAENMTPGTIGPDGCLYAGFGDTIYRMTRTDGSCDFAPVTVRPSLTLAPSEVLPDPAQGTAQTFTATFRNLDVPAGTPVQFDVTGVNERQVLVRTNDDGEAVFTYPGEVVGRDFVTASATAGLTDLTSNRAEITWVAGRHVTFLTLNPSDTAGFPGFPVTARASLTDTSSEPSAAVAGATITFTLGGAQCTAVTDANGIAACQLVATQPGIGTLGAAFAGSPTLVDATDSRALAVLAGGALGPFVAYKAAATKGTPKFVKFGAVTLADAFETAAYDVVKLSELATPANVGAFGFVDPETYLETYGVKRAKTSGKFVKRVDLEVASLCGGLVATASKPVAFLVPTAADPTQPVTPPATDDHNLDHFLCYQAKTQKKRSDGTAVATLTKGTQVEVADDADPSVTRRYDLKKLAWICNPATTSGMPVALAGSAKGLPVAFTPVAARNDSWHLVCYAAKLAKNAIPQSVCGPVDPKNKGTKIVPPQAKPLAQVGVNVANLLASGDVDTKKSTVICLPARVTAP